MYVCMHFYNYLQLFVFIITKCVLYVISCQAVIFLIYAIITENI